MCVNYLAIDVDDSIILDSAAAAPGFIETFISGITGFCQALSLPLGADAK